MTFVPAATITQLPISNMAAGTIAAVPRKACTTGKQKHPTLNPEPLSMVKARSCTGRLREVRKMMTGGMKATTKPNTEIHSMLESCGFVANE